MKLVKKVQILIFQVNLKIKIFNNRKNFFEKNNKNTKNYIMYVIVF